MHSRQVFVRNWSFSVHPAMLLYGLLVAAVPQHSADPLRMAVDQLIQPLNVAPPLLSDQLLTDKIEWSKLDVSVINLDSRTDRLDALADSVHDVNRMTPFAASQICRVPAVNATALLAPS